MSHPTAMAWTSLGVTLRWKLPDTWAALNAGHIDLYRARRSPRPPPRSTTTRPVPWRRRCWRRRAGRRPGSSYRFAPGGDRRRPGGAEQRRREAQRHAKVSLYPDPDACLTRYIRVQPPPLAALAGKGRKIRHVPLGGNTAALLSAYLAEHGLDRPGHDDHPLFASQHGNKLSRGGIAWIIGKYQAQAGDPALARRRSQPACATP